MFLPRWNDFFNVSFDNLIWGKPLKLFFPDIRGGELLAGFPLLTLFLFFACLFYFYFKRQDKDFAFDPSFPLIMGFSVLIIMFLILRIFNFSLWLALYLFVPGASALRVIARYNVFLSLPISIVLAFGAEALILKWKIAKNFKIVFITFILLFLLLENTVSVTNTRWSIKGHREQFAKVVPPPKDCKVFAIMPKAKKLGINLPFIYQLDAWVIANKFNLQTINGYSGHEPPYWGNLSDPNNLLKYEYGLRGWSKLYNLTNLCSYSQDLNKWSSPDFLKIKALSKR